MASHPADSSLVEPHSGNPAVSQSNRVRVNKEILDLEDRDNPDNKGNSDNRDGHNQGTLMAPMTDSSVTR